MGGRDVKRAAMPRRSAPLRGGEPPARRIRIRPRSRKRAAQEREYRRVREHILRACGWRCELRTRVCTGRADQVHHLEGRDGERLTRASMLRATCSDCHDYAHAHPAESYAAGWLVRRNGPMGGDAE
jgi:hypothetical protein